MRSMPYHIKTAKRSLLTLAALSLALVVTTSAVHGAGFAIYETDARGLAMGNASVGRIDDASALYFNPAAITQLPGVQVVVGSAFISPSVKVDTVVSGTSTPTPMDDYTQPVPHFYATYRINDDMAAGLGIFVPFGLKSDFSTRPTWPGAYNNYFTKIETIEIAPTFAYRVVHDQPWAKQISVAAGIAILNAKVDLRSRMPAFFGYDTNADVRALANQPMILKGSTWEYGYNLAVQYEINDQVSFGMVYRSGFNLGFTGANAWLGDDPKRGGASGQIKLPDSFAIGVNYSPVVPLNLGFQALWTGWSRYDWLRIQNPTAPTIDTTIPGMGALPADTLQTINKRKDWSNVWRYSFGAEYQINNAVALRAGFVIDKDPVNKNYADFMVPSDDRLIFSAGVGWTINKQVMINFGLAYLKIKSTTYSQNAIDNMKIPGLSDVRVHSGNATILSASANFRF